MVREIRENKMSGYISVCIKGPQKNERETRGEPQSPLRATRGARGQSERCWNEHENHVGVFTWFDFELMQRLFRKYYDPAEIT